MYTYWWVIVLIVVLVVAAFILFTIVILRSQRHIPITTGKESMVGSVALAHTVLNPKGMVYVEGELWTATSEAGKIEVGEEVVVTKVEGLKLKVTKIHQGGDKWQDGKSV